MKKKNFITKRNIDFLNYSKINTFNHKNNNIPSLNLQGNQ